MRGWRAALVGEMSGGEARENTTQTPAKVGRRGYDLRLYEPGPPRLIFERTTFTKEARFHNLDLSQSRFQQVDLSNVSFLHSQIHQTRFIGCQWGEGPESWRLFSRQRPWWRWRRPRLMYDELQWRKNYCGYWEKRLSGREGNRLPLSIYKLWDRIRICSFWPSARLPDNEYTVQGLITSDIEVLALQLKQSLETSKDPITAGDFHFAAMEMKLAQAREKGRPWRALGLWLYKVVSGYGERPGRTAGWLSLLALGLTFLLFLGNFSLPGCPESWTWIRGEEAFFHVLSHMLPFKLGSMSSGQPTLEGLLRWITLGETLVGTTLFTMFVLALRRRFKR